MLLPVHLENCDRELEVQIPRLLGTDGHEVSKVGNTANNGLITDGQIKYLAWYRYIREGKARKQET